MPTTPKPAHVEYMCRKCGTKAIRRSDAGRPTGTCSKNGGKPHVWVVNRRMR